jgi:hypothetical protein
MRLPGLKTGILPLPKSVRRGDVVPVGFSKK